MIKALVGAAKRRMKAGDEGFTLIELAVVMLIIAILVVVSLAFFGLIGTAHSSVSLQDLRGADTAAKTIWTQNGGSFPSSATTIQTSLTNAEPGVAFITGPDTSTTKNPNTISYVIGTNGQSAEFESYANANGGECVELLDIASTSSVLVTGTAGFTNAGVYWNEATGQTSCTAAMPTSNTGWTTTPPAS